MCGIAGLVRFDDRPVDPALLRRMTMRLRHRGPDAQHAYVNGPVGLGHTRLSIIDLGGGDQPMHTPDRALSVTFNGEIFNYVELRETLRGKGYRFATNSDTEVILHAYAEYGDDCVRHFNGDFAFAVWDRRRRRLFAARDRLGVRPFYYAVTGRSFLFASEIKSLLACDDVPRAVDPAGLDQLFTFWCPLPPRTVFRGINELPPAHTLTVENGRVEVRRYWQVQYETPTAPRSEDDYADELLALLEDATRLRMRSDVPVGAYLSGGLDSTVTTALARRVSTGGDLQTFSVTFDDAEFDESDYQRLASATIGTEHHSVRISQSEIGAAFPDVVRHAERPMLRTAPTPLFLLSKLVRDVGFKVVLTGEGADEMLGGYDIFKEAKVRRFCAARPNSTFRTKLFGKLYPYLPNLQKQSPAYLRAFFHARPEDLDDPFFSHRPRWELTARLKQFFSDELRESPAGMDAVETCRAGLPDDYARWQPFNQSQFLETTMLLPGYILSSQGDRAAMAHAVEGRFPFLDHRLAEFAARLPVRLKMKGLQEKYLLKRATRHLVPEAVRRRPKQPYRAPDAASFVSRSAAGATLDYVKELLSPARIAADGLFQPVAVERLLVKVRSGTAIGVKDNMALVGILSTQLLIDQFVRSAAAWADADVCQFVNAAPECPAP